MGIAPSFSNATWDFALYRHATCTALQAFINKGWHRAYRILLENISSSLIIRQLVSHANEIDINM